jgi:hypothetical protein
VYGRRNQSAAPQKPVATGGVVHRHDDGFTQKAAEKGVVTGFFAGNGNQRAAVVFLLITPMAISSAMMAARVSCGVAGDGHHIQAHTAHTGHGLELFDGQVAAGSRLGDVQILADRNKCAAQSPDL